MSKISAVEAAVLSDIDITVEDIEFERQVVLKKRKEAGRVQCPGCRRGIRKGQPMVIGNDKLQYHVFCAVDDQKIAICQSCFMVSCDCEKPAALVITPSKEV